MTELGLTYEREEITPGVMRLVQHLRPIAYRDGSLIRRITNDWVNSGDATRPHVVTAGPFLVSVGVDGLRRIHPTREADRYFEIGAPYIRPAGVWQKANLGSPTRIGNRLLWTTTNANMLIDFGGHFVKLAIILKNGWQPPNGQFAFPVSLNGLTRSGRTLLADGLPVMTMVAPHVEDLDNPADVRPITVSFANVSGQTFAVFTLPSLSGMSRPLIDPTLSLQPDSSSGTDTLIRTVDPNFAHGALTLMRVGHRDGTTDIVRSLIKFDLSSLPDNAVISSCTLSLFANVDESVNARAFRVYRLKRAWVESEATWNQWTTGNNWQTAGAFGANDAEQTDIGSRAFTAAETLNVFKDFALTPTSKTGLDLGNGWLIKADTENSDAYTFATSEASTASQRPKLEIIYTEAAGGMLLKRVQYHARRR